MLWREDHLRRQASVEHPLILVLLGGGTWRNEIWKSAVAQVAWARPWRNHLPGFERRRGCTWTRHTSQHPHRTCSVSATLVIVALTHLCLLLAAELLSACIIFRSPIIKGAVGKYEEKSLISVCWKHSVTRWEHQHQMLKRNCQHDYFALAGSAVIFFFQKAMNNSCWAVNKENDWFNHWPFNKDLGWWTQHLSWDQLCGPSQGCVRTDVSGGWCPVMGPGAHPAEHTKCCPLGLPCLFPRKK